MIGLTSPSYIKVGNFAFLPFICGVHGQSVKNISSVSFFGFNLAQLGTNKIDSKQKQALQEFRKEVIRTALHTIGAAPTRGNPEAWTQQVIKNPRPIEYKLTPIYKITSKYHILKKLKYSLV